MVKRTLFSSFLGFWIVAFFVVALSGCLGSKHTWRGSPVITEEVRVVPQEIYRRKDRLFVRVTVYNLSRVPLTVDRDGVTAQLANGEVLARSSGTTTQHRPYTIYPGETHSVYVDFRGEGVEDAGGANIFWTGALWDGSRQLQVPATPVRGR